MAFLAPRAPFTALLSFVSICGMAAGAPPSKSGPASQVKQAAAAPAEHEIHPSRVLVRFKAEATAGEVEAAKRTAGVIETVYSYPRVPGLYCVRVPEGSVRGAVETLNADAAVRYAEVDYIMRAEVQETPYGIAMVNAPNVWPTYGFGAGARVAVLDTGVQLTHPDLPTPVEMMSFISGQTVDDYHSHGTHTSGTVLALNNDIGVVGVAPGASLMTGKVLSNGGSGPTSGVMAGVQWAADNGANVVSMSLGGGGYQQSFSDLAQAVFDDNVVICASAGNSASSNPSYPGSYTAIMCVSAIDSAQNIASFSNFGPTIDITAPGVSVRSTVPLINSNVTWNNTPHTGTILSGSAIAGASGQMIYCGFGGDAADFPASVNGNIAHIRRGNGVSFFDKANNALNAGAVGVVISNNTTGSVSGTLNASFPIPVVGITQAHGNELQAISGVQGSIAIQFAGSSYSNFNGTSMSCPHVAGVAGLMYSIFGPQGVTSAQVRQALEASATDLGDPGRDDLFGHGLVNASAAVAYLGAIFDCIADFNRSGGTPDDADVAAFFSAWNAGDSGADVNGSGGTPDDADVTFFFMRWNLGC